MPTRVALITGTDDVAGECSKLMRQLGFRVVDEPTDGLAPRVLIECPSRSGTVDEALVANVIAPLQRIRAHLHGRAGTEAGTAVVLVGLADEAGAPSPVRVAAPARARLLTVVLEERGDDPGGPLVVLVEPGTARPATVAAVVRWLLDPGDSLDGPPIQMLHGDVIDAVTVAREYGLDV